MRTPKQLLLTLILLVLFLIKVTPSDDIKLFSTTVTSNSTCLLRAELDALQDLFISTKGDSWLWEPLLFGNIWNFTLNPDPCGDRWQGVLCSNVTSTGNCSIYKLDLNNYNLQGYIPNSINNLTLIKYIDLSQNNITSTIPYTLSTLKNLQYLDLCVNNIIGSIPNQLDNIIQLEYLCLGSNYITNTIPIEIGNLTNLIFLYFLTELTIFIIFPSLNIIFY